MYIVTVYYKSGSVSLSEAHSEGEMLDRVRIFMASEYSERVEVIAV